MNSNIPMRSRTKVCAIN